MPEPVTAGDRARLAQGAAGHPSCRRNHDARRRGAPEPLFAAGSQFFSGPRTRRPASSQYPV